jgi:hypothetical protein
VVSTARARSNVVMVMRRRRSFFLVPGLPGLIHPETAHHGDCFDPTILLAFREGTPRLLSAAHLGRRCLARRMDTVLIRRIPGALVTHVREGDFPSPTRPGADERHALRRASSGIGMNRNGFTLLQAHDVGASDGIRERRNVGSRDPAGRARDRVFARERTSCRARRRRSSAPAFVLIRFFL